MPFHLQFIRFPCVTVLTIIALAAYSPAADSKLAEKRPLDHEDYAKWNSLGSISLSHDGRWASYVSSPGEGQGTLTIREIASEREYEIQRGSRMRFTDDSQHAIYVVSPDEELVKKLKKEKKPDSELPQPEIQVLHLESGQSIALGDGSRFELPAKASGWVAFLATESEDENAVSKDQATWSETYNITPEGIVRPEKQKQFRKEETAESTAGEGASKTEEGTPSKVSGEQQMGAEASKASGGKDESTKKKKKEKTNGKTLVLRDLEGQLEWRFPFVVNFRFSENAERLAFTTSGSEPEQDGVHVLDLKELELTQVLAGRGNYGQVVFSKDGRQLAFLTDRDDYDAETPAWNMYHWRRGRREAEQIISRDSDGIPDNWVLSSRSAPFFSEDGKRIYFRTRPEPQVEDEEEEQEPVANLDLWHWQDPFLQPEQKLRASAERNRSFQAVYHVRSRKVVQLADEQVPTVSINPRRVADVTLGFATRQYDIMKSWDVQSFGDWYLINVETGKRTILAERKRGRPSLSPAGHYVVWWDGEQETWFAQSTAGMHDDEELKEAVDLGEQVPYPLVDELHDQPSLPGPAGRLQGWLEDDAGLLLKDRWDLWLVDPAGRLSAECLTDEAGRRKQISFQLLNLDSEARFVDLESPQMLSAREHETKASGFYRLTAGDEASKFMEAAKKSSGRSSKKSDESASQVEHESLQPLVVLDEQLTGLTKARDSEVVLFRRSSFERYPDLWSSTTDFKTTRRISRINPQQDEYRWGTAELVSWTAQDGQELDGILYKPEGFDPSQKYPLMVYFYERNSDNLHTHYVPAAGRSIINFSFYVSRGYVIFVPDIPYEVGQPGPSAANAVLPGVESIVKRGFVDPDRIGMQGHSWGGYQTAYLVTVSDMFACAESGAPVSNMTSAYGGIRWGSGLSRMFQYEKTQSRIGATLWESPELYIQNSPLFSADKINTPLLILHNDEDTAVPWYQGIELFVALRRLGKPAWMLNYNGEPHWVMKDENRMDFARRMQQFFDHYLKGDPMPVWMAEGIPAVDKGKEFGFEYLRPSGAEEESAEEKQAAEAAAVSDRP